MMISRKYNFIMFMLFVCSAFTLSATDFVCNQKVCAAVNKAKPSAQSRQSKFHFVQKASTTEKIVPEEPSSFTTYDYAVASGVGFLLYYLGKVMLSCCNFMYNVHTHARQRMAADANPGPRLVLLVPLQTLHVLLERQLLAERDQRLAEWFEGARSIGACLANLFPQYVHLNLAAQAAPAA